MTSEAIGDNAVTAQFKKNRVLDEPSEDGQAKERATLAREVKRLLKEGKDFESSKSERNRKLMKAALVVAGVSTALNFVLGVAIAAMMPLKSVEPLIVEVNKISGEVATKQPLRDPRPTYSEATDIYYIENYVIARESYDWGLIQRYFNTVKAFSYTGSSTWNEYNTFVYSPRSPLAVLANKARIVVDVTSTTPDTKTNTAVVRFTKTVIGADGNPASGIPRTHWVATLRYEYTNPKLSPDERRMNPPGMKIPSYQTVQERGEQ